MGEPSSYSSISVNAKGILLQSVRRSAAKFPALPNSAEFLFFGLGHGVCPMAAGTPLEPTAKAEMWGRHRATPARLNRKRKRRIEGDQATNSNPLGLLFFLSKLVDVMLLVETA